MVTRIQEAPAIPNVALKGKVYTSQIIFWVDTFVLKWLHDDKACDVECLT